MDNEKTKGYIKIVIGIEEEITEEKFYEIMEDLVEGMRGSLDVQFDIPYRIFPEVHRDS